MSEHRSDLSTTPRLFVDMPLAAGVTATLPVPQSHYLAQVMRRQPGDVVRLFNGADGEWAARLTSVGRKAVAFEIEHQSAEQELVPDLWLCFAPIKRGRSRSLNPALPCACTALKTNGFCHPAAVREGFKHLLASGWVAARDLPFGTNGPKAICHASAVHPQ